ncbi:DUF3291 domain-containing protein [Streptomyces roseirectus]|uniref:DUF3291 domain-containing protein n=1 Tax=Streptomyces roseirectus TaxID=2768066 RepID=UPI003CCD1351
MTSYQLAQVNISRLKFPLDSPELKDFIDALEPVNADADSARGFVWRLGRHRELSQRRPGGPPCSKSLGEVPEGLGCGV